MSFKEKLEEDYAVQIKSQSIENAYSTLGELMRYGFIGKDDERLSNDYYKKVFKGAGIDKKHRFVRDLRSSESFVPEWWEVKLPASSVKASINIPEHAGKRLEHGYEGDVIVPSRDVPIVVRPISRKMSAINSLAHIREMYVKYNKAAPKTLTDEDVISGARQLYAVEVSAGHNVLVNNFGYISVKMVNGVVSCGLILDPFSIEKNNMNIGDTYRTVWQTLKTEIQRLNSAELALEAKVFTSISNYKKTKGA